MTNPKIANVNVEVILNTRFNVKRVTNDYQKKDGSWQKQERDIFDVDNASTLLLYNAEKRTVILTWQFRVPTYLNGSQSGMLLEACAGLLDTGETPEQCAIREALEETGYKISGAKKIFEAYMTPGSVTGIVHFFVAPYTDEMKVTDGGGHVHEQENIEVFEMPFDKVYDMMERGEIKDGKTIMLIQYAKINKLFDK